MRRKITQKNYGKYHEAILVSSTKYFDFCSAVADNLSTKYGILAKAVNFEEHKEIPKDVKRLLSKSYHVIFCLSDNIIEESLASGKDHPFSKFYAYTHKTNPFSISCVTLNFYQVSDNLEYPKYMGDFESLHRINFPVSTYGSQIDLSCVYSATDKLAKEIRMYYNTKTVKILEGMQASNVLNSMASHFNDILFIAPKILITNIIVLLLLFLTAFNLDYFTEGLFLFFIPAIGVFFVNTFTEANFAKKKEAVYLDQYNSIFAHQNDPITQSILNKAENARRFVFLKKFIINFLILLVETAILIYAAERSLYFIAIYLIKHIISLAINIKDSTVMKKRINEFKSYLDFSIASCAQNKKSNKIKFILFIIASLIFSLLLFSTIS